MDAIRSELEHGASLVTITDDLSVHTSWGSFDDEALLSPAPAGMRYALRWVNDPPTEDFTVVMQAGQTAPDLPLKRAVPPDRWPESRSSLARTR